MRTGRYRIGMMVPFLMGGTAADAGELLAGAQAANGLALCDQSKTSSVLSRMQGHLLKIDVQAVSHLVDAHVLHSLPDKGKTFSKAVQVKHATAGTR